MAPGDNIAAVPPKTATRGHTIPRVDWWCVAATAAADGSGLSREQLASELLARFGYETTDASVVRCLNGKVLTIELARYLSEVFSIPPPVFIPTSLEEAWAILGKREVERVRAQIAVLSAGVDQSRTGDHTHAVQVADERTGRVGKRGRLERRRG